MSGARVTVAAGRAGRDSTASGLDRPAAEGRQAAYDLMRRLEPALDADGLSTSARAVLARIRPTR